MGQHGQPDLRASSRAAPGGRRCSRRSPSPASVIAVNLIADSVESVYALMSCTTLAPAPSPRRSKIDDLQVAYIVRGIPREVLRGVSFEVAPGEAYGLVGESGCGKSTTAYAALRYLPSQRSHHRRARPRRRRRRDRAWTTPRCAGSAPREASMVYQDPGAALNPVLRDRHRRSSSASRCSVSPRTRPRSGALEALRRVRIADPGARHAALPAPAVRRHAAARGDRDGAGMRPEAARARRADHRSRRHRRGRGARPRARPAQPRPTPRSC